MLNKSQIANGIFAAALIYDLYISRKNRNRFNEILEENNNLEAQVNHTLYAANYMAQKLADNEIDLSDFDLIALNNPM